MPHLRSIFVYFDFNVLAVCNNRKQLEKALSKHKKNINLITLDINLGKENSLNYIPYIKSKVPDTKIIMVSANSSMKNLETALNLGADHFIRKPFELEKITVVLGKVFNIDLLNK